MNTNGIAAGGIILRPRLAAVAEGLALLGGGDLVIDVGADHAALPIWLVQNGVFDRAVATDANEKPLQKASANIARAGLTGTVTLSLGDGFAAVSDGVFDERASVAAVVAGMGGHTIARVIRDGGNKPRMCGLLALQPMNNHDALRRALIGMDYAIIEERVVVDAGRAYVVIFARRDGERYRYGATDYAVGKNTPIGDEAARRRLLRFARKIAQNRLDGLLAEARGGADVAGKAAENAENPTAAEYSAGAARSAEAEIAELRETLAGIDARARGL